MANPSETQEVKSIEENVDNLPSVDFANKLKMASREKECWEVVKKVAQNAFKAKEKIGLIVVLGYFDRQGGCVKGMKQVKGTNPVDSLIWITGKAAPDMLTEWARPPHDGAIVVNHTGQIIGANIMLILESFDVESTDEYGMRHIAAASFSKREEVIATFTISEESGKARMFKDGREYSTEDPSVKKKKNEEDEEE